MWSTVTVNHSKGGVASALGRQSRWRRRGLYGGPSLTVEEAWPLGMYCIWPETPDWCEIGFECVHYR